MRWLNTKAIQLCREGFWSLKMKHRIREMLCFVLEQKGYQAVEAEDVDVQR